MSNAFYESWWVSCDLYCGLQTYSRFNLNILCTWLGPPKRTEIFAVPSINSIQKMASQSAITIDIKLGFCSTSLMAAQGLSHRLLTEEPLLALRKDKNTSPTSVKLYKIYYQLLSMSLWIKWIMLPIGQKLYNSSLLWLMCIKSTRAYLPPNLSQILANVHCKPDQFWFDYFFRAPCTTAHRKATFIQHICIKFLPDGQAE